MLSQLFFVLLALTLITFTPEEGTFFWIQSPMEAFQWGFLSYGAFLILLFFESKYLAHIFRGTWKGIWYSFVNIELILFLCFFHFGLGAQRFFLQGKLASYQTPYTLASLFFYFFALGWTQFWYCHFQENQRYKKALKKAWQYLLFFLPFCLPFVIMTLLFDGIQHLSLWQESKLPVSHDHILFGISVILLILTLIFLPACLIFCWRCRPIENIKLRSRLEEICYSLHFRHAGFKIWPAMSHSYTAGIVGIVPQFRYILFTSPLLQNFASEEIEAILTHEIGHNRYRHLIFYPFIMLGMLIFGALLLIGLEKSFFMPFDSPFFKENHFSVLMTLFVVYSLALAVYFRFVFGFFSRLFERQADLYIFESPLSPTFLIQAFDHLGYITGNTHSHPSWHHFSLQERIHFLNECIDNPILVQQHHKRVRKWLIIYFLGLILCSLFLYFFS